MRYDLLITNGLLFDGHGSMPVVEDLAITDGKVVARGRDLDPADAEEIYDAEGKWVIPGMLDIHTHYDLEIELAPGLIEAARHGTTTVVMSNCSLGTTYGKQQRDNGDYVENPIVDCFARVENIPKPVLERVVDQIDWEDSHAYLDHLDDLPLGANVVPQIPHSMLRAEVMGLRDSVSRNPRPDEIARMSVLLQEAMQQGYAGFSTDALPFHYLANDPNRKTKIPSQWTTREEMKALTGVVRSHDRVWQGTPPKDSPVDVVKTFSLTSGRLHGKPLRTTIVAAMDIDTDRTVLPLAKVLMRVFNSKLLKGNFRMQALAAEFKVWADGPLTPLFEEIPELRELNEPDLEDVEGRMAILDDPDWQARFRAMWNVTGLGKLRQRIRYEDIAIPRDLRRWVLDTDELEPAWKGKTFHQIRRASFPKMDEADFVIHMLRTYDLKLRWYATTANSDLAKAKESLFDKHTLPGFNDSGAHLTNMAFYDANLRGLQWADEVGLERVAWLVKRLTSEPADFWNVDAGTLDVGARADVAVIDPQRLRSWTPEETIEVIYREEFDNSQMVNRPEGIVTLTTVAGQVAWRDGEIPPEVGKIRMGQTLLANNG